MGSVDNNHLRTLFPISSDGWNCLLKFRVVIFVEYFCGRLDRAFHRIFVLDVFGLIEGRGELYDFFVLLRVR